MNRNLFQAASAAFLCLALAACGGGGGGDTTQTASTSPAPGTSSSTVNDGTTGTKSNPGAGSGTNPGSPGDGTTTYPIPNCTPRQVVVSLLGDTIMQDEFYTGQLQKELDNHFGAGAAVVYNYALKGDTSSTYLYVSGDVIVENYGVFDMVNGVTTTNFTQNLLGMHATLVVTQNPIVSTLYDPTPYLAAENGLGLPVADVYSYMQTLGSLPALLNTDGIHPTNDTAKTLITNVIAPAVFTQVAPLRCQLN